MSQATKVNSPVEVEKRKKLDIRAGDSVRVSVKIEEKGKTRTQEFEGIVLSRKHGNEPGATFTVRRTSGGIGVEKVFPLFSPVIEKIEVVKRAKVRQSNIYHIREKAAKKVRRHIKNVRSVSETDEDQEVAEEDNVPEVVEETVLEETEEINEEVKKNTENEVAEEAGDTEKEEESDTSEEKKEKTS